MPVRKQNTAQSVVAKGYRTANYIRLGLAFFFTAAVLGTGFGSFDRMGIQAEAVGTVVYFLIGIIGLYRMRGGRSPVVFSKAAAVGDMTADAAALRAMGKRGRGFVASWQSPARVAQRYEELFEALRSS